MVKVSTDVGGTAYVARLCYDGDGRRAKRVDAFGSIHYAGPHYERNVGTGADTTEVVTKLYWVQLGSYRRLVAFRRGGVLYFVHSDHLGGTNILSDVTGNEVGALRYYAFGQTRVQTGLVPTDKRFTGQTLDASSGLYFYGARYYDPALGRFVQPDSIVPQPGNPQSLNRYSYVLNNPLKYTDPTGNDVMFIGGIGTKLDTEDEAWAAMIEQLGLREGEYAFFDWSAGGRYPGTASDYGPLSDAAWDLAEALSGKTDVTLIGHSKGGDLILEYLAQVAEGKLPSNAEVERAFILDSPTGGTGGGIATLRRFERVDQYNRGVWVSSSVRDRLGNLPQRLSAATSRAMTVDVAMIANLRDIVSGPSIPGMPYFTFKAGNEQRGERFLAGGVGNLFGVAEIHGLVQSDPWVAGLIKWYRQW